ncbi:LacI family DNA-binding transcriptional regulator [Actinomyces respiraculi]|uniref:LacI family DNA-binding transcriptional regulator n=1 Tax=Actinomyces respiraculi TaxID=2744574 RepID=A0A7T0PWA0_9ACTO|nr:LacI family DNA-binding transcriptional regulator [Actinomyces respiraculi]QPL04640.1 LacI family DNA-binding transcriptional regulator [Actinomyces respiraculi]
MAQRVGVSQATVSRALNGKPGVSDKTRRTIMETMRELGMVGESVQLGTPRQVALVAPDLSNPVFAAFVTSISTYLARHNLLPVLCTYTLRGASETSLLGMVLKQQPIGVIFLAGRYDTEFADHSDYAMLYERHLPTVFINATAPGLRGQCVMTDDAAGTRMAMRHLVSQGHTRIGLLLGDRHHYPSLIKYEAARSFAKEAGLDLLDEATVWTTYGFESGRDAALRFGEQGVTALLCASDQLALGAVRALRSLGLDVPGDVSVIGYDDSSWLPYTSPALTTVRQSVDAMSRTAVDALLRCAQDPALLDQRRDLVFEPELVVRESTGICRTWRSDER